MAVCRPAPLVAVLPSFARFGSSFARSRLVIISPCVCPSVSLSCDFAPLPCVFLAFPCLALLRPSLAFVFKPFFVRFSARFGSARAIYQGNKKPVLGGNFQGVLRSWRFRFRSGVMAEKKTIKKGQAVKPAPVAYSMPFSLNSAVKPYRFAIFSKYVCAVNNSA